MITNLPLHTKGYLEGPRIATYNVRGNRDKGGTVAPVQRLAKCLQVGFDAGAKQVAWPMMSSAGDIQSIPAALLTKFQTSFYAARWMWCLRRLV